MPRERMVVIGGDAAGMSAASQARKRRSPEDLQIVAFEKGRATSYSACGIPYWISGTVSRRDDLISRSAAQHRDNGIDVRIRTEVVGIDLAARTVRARDLEEQGREYDEPFDTLVYATGSIPMRLPIPGFEATGVYGVQTFGQDGPLACSGLPIVRYTHDELAAQFPGFELISTSGEDRVPPGGAPNSSPPSCCNGALDGSWMR